MRYTEVCGLDLESLFVLLVYDSHWGELVVVDSLLAVLRYFEEEKVGWMVALFLEPNILYIPTVLQSNTSCAHKSVFLECFPYSSVQFWTKLFICDESRVRWCKGDSTTFNKGMHPIGEKANSDAFFNGKPNTASGKPKMTNGI